MTHTANYLAGHDTVKEVNTVVDRLLPQDGPLPMVTFGDLSGDSQGSVKRALSPNSEGKHASNCVPLGSNPNRE